MVRHLFNVVISVIFCVLNFHYLVSLENVIGDISELERGMEMTKREYEQRKDRDPPVILKDFLSNSEDKLRRLNVDAKNARVSF